MVRHWFSGVERRLMVLVWFGGFPVLAGAQDPSIPPSAQAPEVSEGTLAPFTHAHASWGVAPADGPAVDITLSNDESPPSTNPAGAPSIQMTIVKSEEQLKATPVKLTAGTDDILLRTNFSASEVNFVNSGTVEITHFDPEDRIEGTYDVKSQGGTRVTGSFRATGMGGHWSDPRSRRGP